MPEPVVVRTGASVHSIDHFALNVPSISEAAHFFGAFGLEVSATGAEAQELDLRAADGHRWARILPASQKSLAWLSFNCFQKDLETIRAQVQAAGASIDASGTGTPSGPSGPSGGAGLSFNPASEVVLRCGCDACGVFPALLGLLPPLARTTTTTTTIATIAAPPPP